MQSFKIIALVAFTTAAFAATAPARAASLAEMAGQMIIVGFQGSAPTDKSIEALTAEIRAGQIGGVMYLRTNVKSLGAVKAMNAGFAAARPEPGLPPFIALDQEGGKVQRLTDAVGFPEMPSAQDVAANDTPAEAEAIYLKTAKGLASVGFNVNFGPVVDLNINPKNPIIGAYGRSFSADPDTVEAYANAFLVAHHEAGLLTALKHFPGHGSSTADSHKGFVDISTTWSPIELAPYMDLLRKHEVDFVMVGHLFDNAYPPAKSADPMPASLSPEWIDTVLRGQLGFTGAVISDDLEMGAIRQMFQSQDNTAIVKQTVVHAVSAGVNVLLFSNTAAYDPMLGPKIQQILVEEAQADPAFAQKIEASYKLVLSLKAKLNG